MPMNQTCDICRRPIPQGELYGQFCMNIERFSGENTVEVKDSKAITTLCLPCAKEFNTFEDAKRLLD